MFTGEWKTISEMEPRMQNVNVSCIVLERGSTVFVQKRNQKVFNFKVGDVTACINMAIWGDSGEYIQPGDIIRVTNGYTAIWRHRLTLYASIVHKVDDFCMAFDEDNNMSDIDRFQNQPAI